MYLRHCVLAAQSCGGVAYDSFMDQTFLADRKTTIREVRNTPALPCVACTHVVLIQYLADNPSIMLEQPPPELVGRYSG